MPNNPNNKSDKTVVSDMVDITNITNKIGNENLEKIKELFESMKDTNEFEFIFFSKKDKNSTMTLTLEKYIALLKNLTKRAELDKNKILNGNLITMDISYNPDKDISYRCTLEGKDTIDKYMRKLSLANNHVIFKNLVAMSPNDKNIIVMKKEKNLEKTVDVDDLYMRVRMADELNLTKKDLNMISEIDETAMDKIAIRFKERTSLYLLKNNDSTVKIDLTITKTEAKYSAIKLAIPKYELEIETMTKKKDMKLLNLMYYEMEFLFKVLQQSNFIISKSETKKVIEHYHNLLMVPSMHALTLYGRQPVSLEIQYTELLANKYAVTDKADGDRNFLVIFNSNVYLINKNLDVKYTGIVLTKEQEKYNNSVVDGELIFLKNRHVFLVFDCLFNSGMDVRKTIKLEERLMHADEIVNACFVFKDQKGYKFETPPYTKDFNLDKNLIFHKNQIKKSFDNLNYDIEIEKKKLLVRRKYFIHSLGAKSWEIYAYSSLIWNSYTEDPNIKCPYILDGLIYQPNDQMYVVEKNSSKSPDYKWKPPEKNSIDFYVEFAKDKAGNIMSIYDNSYDDIADDHTDIEMGEKRIRNQTYKICRLHAWHAIGKTQTPVLFREQDNLHEACLLLKEGEVRDIENNMLSDKTVVEFYYNTTEGVSNKFRWIPLKTRYDKTEAVIKYKQQYGNHISTAENVWKSINNPVLMTDFDELAKGNDPDKNMFFYDRKLDSFRKRIGHDLILSSSRENAYFQKITDLAKDMRAFHNFMKDNLIYTYCHSMYDGKQRSVLDIGVGKGQDIMKYYYAKIKMAVCIDNNKEALMSPLDGAVSRYNKQRRKVGFPKMTFIQANFNSPLDYENQYKSLKGMDSENKELIDRFFSKNQSNRTMFDIISSQFSFHYGLKDAETFTNLKANINDYLRNDGYLLMTTFDAEKVREFLKGKDKHTQEYTDENGNVQTLFEIVKKYEDVPDETIMGTGNVIDVHMAWFMNEGTHQPEYLIDSRFLIEELKRDCDLDLVTTDSFENQYNLYQDFFTKYVQYEANPDTRKNFNKIAEFYKSNSVNDSSKIYTKLERYYVFRKKKYGNKKQKGGELADQNKFYVPIMENSDSDYSLMNSIHHVLKSHSIIPQALSVRSFYSDMDCKMEKDMKIVNDKDIKKIGKKIVIYHQIDNKEKNKENSDENSQNSDENSQNSENNEKTRKIIDGINVIIAERDCNDEFDVKMIKSSSKNNNASVIIIIKEGNWYAPTYKIDEKTKEKNGIFNMDDETIVNMIGNTE